MGSEGKSKKRSSASVSEDEGKSKKHRTRDESDGRSRTRDKKAKLRSEKSHKHTKRHSEKGKRSDKHGSKSDKHDPQTFQELSDDDYFAKNNEFATWLKEEKGLFFSDLSSETARQLFSRFIKAWNKHKLESRYYDGIASGPRTSHNWKISLDK